MNWLMESIRRVVEASQRGDKSCFWCGALVVYRHVKNHPDQATREHLHSFGRIVTACRWCNSRRGRDDSWLPWALVEGAKYGQAYYRSDGEAVEVNMAKKYRKKPIKFLRPSRPIALYTDGFIFTVTDRPRDAASDGHRFAMHDTNAAAMLKDYLIADHNDAARYRTALERIAMGYGPAKLIADDALHPEYQALAEEDATHG